MAKTIIDSRGVVTSPGSGTTIAGIATLNSGIRSFPKVQLLNFTASTGGVYTMSGSTGTGVLTGTLPLAASVPGSMFVFRCTSADAHVISASNVVTADDQLICGVTASHGGVLVGSELKLPATIGASVSFVSDGFNFCVIGGSGISTISSPST